MATQTLTKDEQFFYDEAGYSRAADQTEEEGHMETARVLAHAERYAREHSWYVNWISDQGSCIGCECGSADCACSTGEPHDVFVALLYNENDELMESLGGICQPTAQYRRVIAAELALERIP